MRDCLVGDGECFSVEIFPVFEICEVGEIFLFWESRASDSAFSFELQSSNGTYPLQCV